MDTIAFLLQYRQHLVCVQVCYPQRNVCPSATQSTPLPGQSINLFLPQQNCLAPLLLQRSTHGSFLSGALWLSFHWQRPVFPSPFSIAPEAFPQKKWPHLQHSNPAACSSKSSCPAAYIIMLLSDASNCHLKCTDAPTSLQCSHAGHA